MGEEQAEEVLEQFHELLDKWADAIAFTEFIEESITEIHQTIENFNSNMRFIIEWQDENQRWHRYQEVNHEATAYRTALNRYEATGNRHRIKDGDGHLIDVVP